MARTARTVDRVLIRSVPQERVGSAGGAHPDEEESHCDEWRRARDADVAEGTCRPDRYGSRGHGNANGDTEAASWKRPWSGGGRAGWRVVMPGPLHGRMRHRSARPSAFKAWGLNTDPWIFVIDRKALSGSGRSVRSPCRRSSRLRLQTCESPVRRAFLRVPRGRTERKRRHLARAFVQLEATYSLA
jgi:hypothetical protein